MEFITDIKVYKCKSKIEFFNKFKEDFKYFYERGYQCSLISIEGNFGIINMEYSFYDVCYYRTYVFKRIGKVGKLCQFLKKLLFYKIF